MKKKDSKGEKLSGLLLQTDDSLLNEAYSVDNANKLKDLKAAEAAGQRQPYPKKPVFFRVAAAALSLLLIVGALFVVPLLLRQGGDADPLPPKDTGALLPPDETMPGTSKLPENTDPAEPVESQAPATLPGAEALHINSIDMINYYAALRLLSESSAFSPVSLSAGDPYRIKIASAEKPPVTYNDFWGDVTEGYYPDDTEGFYWGDDTEGPPRDTSEETVPPTSEDPKIYYEKLDPSYTFFLTRASFFRIEITDPSGFLGATLGTGIIDVVITNGFMDDMITFKNGDRYFSCLLNGFSWVNHHMEDEPPRYVFDFSTHKYIDGFYVIKNMAQMNYRFTVTFDVDQAISFECTEWIDNTREGNPDGPLPVVGSTAVWEGNVSFTVAELEDYFNTNNSRV